MTTSEVLGVWQSGETVVEVYAGHRPPAAPVVRLIRLRDGRHAHIRDIDPELAAELAAILDALGDRSAELAAALRAAVEALDP